MTLSTMAAKLRRLREHMRMSRPQFAQLLGIPPLTLKNYENGYRDAIPGAILITLANHPITANYMPYLLMNDRPIDELGVMEQPPVSTQPEIVYSEDGEIFGDYHPDDFESGDRYYSGERKDITPSSLVSKFVIDSIIEHMDEQLAHLCDEAAEGALSIADDKEDELEKVIHAFMDKHCTISCYRVVNIQEHVAGSSDECQGGAV
jgi:putative transcriptional regulator